MKSIEEIREVFSRDRFATDNGAYIESVGDKTAVCSIELNETHMNAYGGVMGGVHFMLADFAFAVATNSEKLGVVSLDSTISYTGAVKGKKIFATANCLKDGRNTVLYKIDITDDTGRLCAVVNTTGYRVE